MNLVLLGLTHRTAPVEVRERHAVAAAAAVQLGEKLVHHPELDEAAIVSTCNRTELMALGPSSDGTAGRLFTFLRDVIGDGSLTADRVFELRDREAVVHLFRVASSLDSMVLGEAQILGQLKDAYRAAVEASSCGPILNRLFHRAFRTAKRVRSQTGLGGSTISVARVGVQLAGEIFETLEGKRAVLVGAGDMAEQALHGFRDAGIGSLAVVNRTVERARSLALRLGGEATALTALEDELVGADVAVTSLAVEQPLLGPTELGRVMQRRQGRSLLLVDLGVPRNVDPASSRLDDVYLYDLDDLEQIADRGRAQRAEAVPAAEAIVAEECERFERWCASLPNVPTVRALRERARDLARREVERAARRLGDCGPETRAALERLADDVVAKLLHEPMARLRDEAENGGAAYYAEAVRTLFALEEEDEA